MPLASIGVVALGWLGPFASCPDVLFLTDQGREHAEEIAAAIAPLELRTSAEGKACFECVIESFPEGDWSASGEFAFVAHDPGSGLRTQTVRLPTEWVVAQNEPDTVRDLGIVFGMPPEGERIGGRRHVRRLLEALGGDAEAEASFAFRGFALRSVDPGRGYEAELAAFLAAGGTVREFPRSRGLIPVLEDLVAIVAADRRHHHLEPGFERAALGLLRAWIQGAETKMAGAAESHSELADGIVRVAIQAIRAARGGQPSPHDPAEVAELFTVFHELSEFASYRELTDSEAASLAAAGPALDAALDVERPARHLRRVPDQPRSAVDPSEYAMVWIDAIRAVGALKPGAASDRTVRFFADVLGMHCLEPREPDPRRNDRHDLWPNLEQLTAELFDPHGAPDSERRRGLFEELWKRVLNFTYPPIAQARRNATLLGIAGWGTAGELDDRAQRVFRVLVRQAGAAAPDEGRSNHLEGADLQRHLAHVEKVRASFEAWLELGQAMGRAAERDGADPSAAVERQLVALRAEAEKWREQGHPDVGLEFLLEQWGRSK